MAIDVQELHQDSQDHPQAMMVSVAVGTVRAIGLEITRVVT